jgi:hypothetical protein
MAEIVRVMLSVFNSQGGQGARLDVTDVSGAIAIPGFGAPPDAAEFLCVTNYGFAPAFFRMGKTGVVATTSCQCVLPGTQTLWTVPSIGQAELVAAAICESGITTKLQMTRGLGN